ncbi:hypothetical protein [Lactobacillus johnsonii]|uniref:YobI-like P-loop NTPase domain-containing protein n=1 Tax=Lactobacillus johnsonii (strain FI9785) TaxID=633699 RepID=D0R4G3_LACJF|nr:hypothetical protein [Lactobacillus johnsonii]CAX66976.1 hypothetical protein predicted by Glimmer/Critica [Lactobacillus johnsonii FI9785]
MSGNLNAKDNVYVPKVYSKKLDELISDPDTNNIAVTAPYDSGKTTMLKSYFKSTKNTYTWYIRWTNKVIDIINKYKQKVFFQPNLLLKIKNYEFINIPNFFNSVGGEEQSSESKEKNEKGHLNSEIEKHKINTEIELEKSIIEQLLYKPNTNRYPDSNLNRLKVWSKFSILCSFIYFIFVVSYLIRLFGKSSIFLWFNSLPIWNNFIFQLLSVAVIGIGTWKTFNSMIHTIGRIKLHASTKMGPVELSGDTEHDKGPVIDLFNYYGDELQYYFHRNNIRVVIFEDLDRFNTPLIFQKLHELNSNLNKSGNSITFIYSLKDKVFSVKGTETSAAALKAKFFDAIIPVFPIHSYRDSSKTFIRESEQYGFVNINSEDKEDYFRERDKELEEKKASGIKIDDKYLKGLGLYIFDTREIKNIISETYFYFAELPLKMFQEEKGGDSNAINKLLAMMVYKNECPDDFDKLASGKESKLENFINGIDNIKAVLVNEEVEGNNEKINDLNSKINILKSQLTPDINILMRVKMQPLIDNAYRQTIRINNHSWSDTTDPDEVQEFWREVLNNDLKYEVPYRGGKEVVSLSSMEKHIFRSYLFDNENMNEISRELNSEKEEIERENDRLQYSISQLQIKDMLTNDTFIKFENKKEKESSDDLVAETIKFIAKNKVLRYLLQQGLIEFDYTDYISPDPYNLTSIEENFVRFVINRKSISISNYRLARVERVIREINNLDSSSYRYKYAYSPDILKYFAEKEIHINYVNVLIESAKDKKQPEFILNSIESLSDFNLGMSNLIKCISKVWIDYYAVAFEKLNSERKNELSRFLLSYLSKNGDHSEDLFNALKKQKIFEDEKFEKEFLVLGEDKFTNILTLYDTYPYLDIEFVSLYSLEKLKQVVIYKWYEENMDNFKTIFDKFANNKFKVLIENKDELKLSDNFIKDCIFNYYGDKNTATFDDLMSLEKFIATDNSDENVNNHLRILTVYLETTIEFTDSEKHQLLEKLGLAKLIKENKFEDINILVELINKNKLSYDKAILEALCEIQIDLAVTYSLKLEREDNIGNFYSGIPWSFICRYLTKTEYPAKIVELIDMDADKKDSNTGWVNVDLLTDAFERILNYTQSIIVMRKLIETAKPLDRKKLILKKLFRKDKFKNQFTKSEISTFLFGDKDFIESWRINGRNVITSDKELLNNYSSELSLLYDELPATFKKKGTKKKIILRKQFDDWFKKEND